jgi:hypothetical protein
MPVLVVPKSVFDDLEMLKLKAAEARRQAAIARNTSNLAIEYVNDCEVLIARALRNCAQTPAEGKHE